MINISNKGIKRMKDLLTMQQHSNLTAWELVDLAILTRLWDLREPSGGPINEQELNPRDISLNILSARPELRYSTTSILQGMVKTRLATMKTEKLIETH